jgi:hypothetical protein
LIAHSLELNSYEKYKKSNMDTRASEIFTPTVYGGLRLPETLGLCSRRIMIISVEHITVVLTRSNTGR